MTSILVFVWGIREWQIESASVNWPAMQAKVTHSQVVRRFLAATRDEIAFAVYDREISLRYTVNGAEYITDFKLPSNASKTPTPNSSYGVPSSAPNTEHITLYYDPENPREAVLHPGDMAAAVRSMAVGGMGIVILSTFILMLASSLSKPGANG